MAALIAAPQGRYATLDTNLGLLQEMVRKDPQSYKEEFEDRFFKFEQRIHLFDFETIIHRKDIHTIMELVTFISGVANNYPDHAKKFSSYLKKVLLDYGPGLEHEIRMSFTKALVALRNKKVITDVEIFEIFFELVKCEDKNLRKFILGSLISFIKQKSQKCSNRKEESNIQNLVISKLKDSRSVVSRIAQLVLIDAFRKKYWRIPKIANALADCVFHKVQRLQVVAMRFFLGSMKDEEGLSDDSEDEDQKNENQKTVKEVMVAFKATKKTKKRLKNLEKTKKTLTKDQKAKKDSRSKECNLEAIMMLYDPQTFSDKLFGLLENKKNEKFMIRIQQIGLCARAIGIHRLQTLGFYSYMHRYLQPKQKEVTRLLLYITQACHELVPPEYIQDVIRVIADNFVSEKNTPEGMTVGLNTIREIYSNCPFAAQEDLIHDLIQYKSYKNKNVSMAARGLISIIRTINPKLLPRKERGRPTEATEEDADMRATEFGVVKAINFVPGAEVLPNNIEDMEDEVDESNSDSDSEWETVSHTDEDENNAKKNEETDDESEVDDDDSDEEIAEDEWVTDDEMEGEDEVDFEDDDEEEVSDDEESIEEQGKEESDNEDDTKSEGGNSSKVSRSVKMTKQAVRQEKKLKKINRDQVKLKRRKEREEQKQAKVEKAQLVSETRILSDADFKRIRVHQIKKKVGATDTRKRTNADSRLEEELEEKRARREGGDGLQRLNDIVHFYKKLKTSKEEKIETAKEGRLPRDEFKKPKKNGPHVGKNKRQAAKNKDFRMVRQKIRGKNRQQSFRDRQKSLRNYLLRQAGRKPNN